MRDNLTGYFVRSKAGHDKGRIYLVMRQDNNSLYVCDGEHQPVNHPKRKNKKHIQPIYQYGRITDTDKLNDSEVLVEVKNVKSRCDRN